MSLATLLANSARCFPDRPALTIGTETYLDYAGLARAASGVAASLIETRGCSPGDPVLLAMSNNRDYLTCLFGCWWAGLTVVPVNAKLHPREIAGIAEDCGARIGFVTPDLAPGLAEACPQIDFIGIGETAFSDLIDRDPIAAADVDAADIAWIFYTSGTTGRPKGAMLSHRNLMAMTLAYLADVDCLTRHDAFLHLAATSHASGLFALSFIAKAANNILPEANGYDAAEMRAILSATEKLTFFAPTVLLNRMADDGLADTPMGNVKTVLTGAGPVHASDIHRAMKTFGPKLWNGYGQGETPCTITAMDKHCIARAAIEGDDEALASVGIPRTGIALRLVDPDGDPIEDPIGSGRIGEVTVRGETVMTGYLNRPDATVQALRGGWLHTGDLGRIDAQGRLHLLDRVKDVIITGGMNVYAREVEAVLLTHPGVGEAAVVAEPNPDWGEQVTALIVPDGTPPDWNELDRLCLDRLAGFKRPKRYVHARSLPKNAAGKVLKAELRARISGRSTEN